MLDSVSDLFDFEDYLSMLDPNVQYDFTRLSGGLINITIRATKRSDDVADGIFPRHKSLVLKYAPPFIAALGESAPFSQARQTTEATALGLFSPNSTFTNFKEETDILVPNLLHHDPEKFVLIIEDLGNLMSIDQLFESLDSLQTVPGDEDDQILERMGRKVGSFFAKLHSARNIQLLDDTVQECFIKASALSTDVVFDAAVKPSQSILQEHGISNHEDLYARIKQDYFRSSLSIEKCFRLGDCWPGSILVRPKIDDSAAVAVIDWEFAGIGRGINSDMAQLLAHFQVLMLHSSLQKAKHIRKFVDGICDAYGSRSELIQAGIPVDQASRQEFWTVFRSALILHGREILNVSSERVALGKDAEFGIKLGVWYLEQAGNSVEESPAEGICSSLRTEPNDMMLPLFGLVGNRSKPTQATSETGLSTLPAKIR